MPSWVAFEDMRFLRWRFQRPEAIDRRAFLSVSIAGLGAALGMTAKPLLGADQEGDEERDDTEKPQVSLPKELRGARCPVTGEKVSANVSLDYLGGKVYFASRDCIPKFKSERAKYEAKARAQLVVTGQFKQVACPVDGKEAVPGIKAKILGVEVHFCSAQCAKKVRQASPNDRSELVFVNGFSQGFAAKQEATVARHAADSDEERWECSICGYVHLGSSPPTSCPQCGAASDSFVRKT